MPLKVIHPVLERHHLADRRLQVRFGTCDISMIVNYGRLVRGQLWKRLKIELFSQTHLVDTLCKLEPPLHRLGTLLTADAEHMCL